MIIYLLHNTYFLLLVVTVASFVTITVVAAAAAAAAVAAAAVVFEGRSAGQTETAVDELKSGDHETGVRPSKQRR